MQNAIPKNSLVATAAKAQTRPNWLFAFFIAFSTTNAFDLIANLLWIVEIHHRGDYVAKKVLNNIKILFQKNPSLLTINP